MLAYITGNIPRGFRSNNRNGIMLHLMSFQKILLVCVGIVCLQRQKKTQASS